MRALLFDTFGTLVDWRSSLINAFTEFGRLRRWERPWADLVDEWRALYQPMVERVRSGDLPWTDLDNLHRLALVELLPRFRLTDLASEEIDELTLYWHRLSAWPDTVPGLSRLKHKFILSPLSNGNFSLLVAVAKFAGLPFDAILGSDFFKHYKPDPETYLGACAIFKMPPGEMVMVAAHNYDLEAARELGLVTAFVARPHEYGPRQKKDLRPEGPWDFVAKDMIELAELMGC